MEEWLERKKYRRRNFLEEAVKYSIK